MPVELSPIQRWFLEAIYYWQKWPGPEIADRGKGGGRIVGLLCRNERPGVPLAFLESEFPAGDSILGEPLGPEGLRGERHWGEIDDLVHRGLVLREKTPLEESHILETPIYYPICIRSRSGHLIRILRKDLRISKSKSTSWLILRTQSTPFEFNIPTGVPTPYFFLTPKGIEKIIDGNNGPPTITLPKKPAGISIDRHSRRGFWRDQPLGINAHADFEVLECLVAANGALVPYGKLLSRIKPREANSQVVNRTSPPEVVETVKKIKIAFQRVRATYTVKNIRGKGYRLDKTKP